jgi:hypothetical protein
MVRHVSLIDGWPNENGDGVATGFRGDYLGLKAILRGQSEVRFFIKRG